MTVQFVAALYGYLVALRAFNRAVNEGVGLDHLYAGYSLKSVVDIVADRSLGNRRPAGAGCGDLYPVNARIGEYVRSRNGGRGHARLVVEGSAVGSYYCEQ